MTLRNMVSTIPSRLGLIVVGIVALVVIWLKELAEAKGQCMAGFDRSARRIQMPAVDGPVLCVIDWCRSAVAIARL